MGCGAISSPRTPDGRNNQKSRHARIQAQRATTKPSTPPSKPRPQQSTFTGQQNPPWPLPPNTRSGGFQLAIIIHDQYGLELKSRPVSL